MKPTSWSTNLPSELNQWYIQWTLHQAPFGFGENRLGSRDVFGISIVGGTCNGLLFTVQYRVKYIDKGFHQDGFHHASTITKDVSTKRVNDLCAVSPCYSPMDCILADIISTKINQWFPFYFTTGRNALCTIGNW